jgi:transcriptional regulator with XRE-family HTH domain
VSSNPLQRAILEANMTAEEVAEKIEVDARTVARWMAGGRLSSKNRVALCRLLGATAADLWPDLSLRLNEPRNDPDFVRLYTVRGDVPQALWRELLDRSRSNVDIFVYDALFLAEGDSELVRRMLNRAADGVCLRLLFGTPTALAVRLRGMEEGIGDNILGRMELALRHLRGAFDVPGIKVRTHATTLYNSIFRFDDEMLVGMHAFGAIDVQSPVLHLKRAEGGRLFDYYLASFEHVWLFGEPAQRPRPR